MDEILFRLSNYIELKQIQGSVKNDQCQQLFHKWLTEGQKLIGHVNGNLNFENLNDFFKENIIWLQEQMHMFNNKLESINFSVDKLYGKFTRISTLMLRREFIYLYAGLIVGTLIGYWIAINRHIPYHSYNLRAIISENYFDKKINLINDAEMPTIKKSNELLIQVKAASINDVDEKICSGYSKVYRKLLNTGRYKNSPVILGRDCAGIVVDIGSSITHFKTGDKVYLAVPSWSIGTLVEYIVVSETQVAKMPTTLSFEESACLPYSGCLALDALINGAAIKKGDARGKRVLIYGGETPEGSILIQLIKLWDGYVVTVCSVYASHLVEEMGADEVIVLKECNIFKELKVRDKFDAIFYTGGHSPLNENILRQYLLDNGCLVSTLPQNLLSDSFGYICEPLFAGYIKLKLMFQYIFGFNMNNWNDGSKINTAYLESLKSLVEANKLKPLYHKVFLPIYIHEAFSYMTNYRLGCTIIKF